MRKLFTLLGLSFALLILALSFSSAYHYDGYSSNIYHTYNSPYSPDYGFVDVFVPRHYVDTHKDVVEVKRTYYDTDSSYGSLRTVKRTTTDKEEVVTRTLRPNPFYDYYKGHDLRYNSNYNYQHNYYKQPKYSYDKYRDYYYAPMYDSRGDYYNWRY